jgi:hypothetical protein
MQQEILVGIAVFLLTGGLGFVINSLYKRYLRDRAFPTRIDAVENSVGELVQVSNVLLSVNIAQTESIGTLLKASKATLEALQGNCNGNVSTALEIITSHSEKHENAQSKLSEYIQDRAKISVKRG